MKCYVCFHEYSGMEKCPCCGEIPPAIIAKTSEEREKTLVRWGKEIREEKLKNVKISFISYNYSMNKGEVHLDSKEEIELLNKQVMEFDQIFWADGDFIRLENAKKLDITIKVENGKAISYEKTATLNNPGVDTDWEFGVKLVEGLKVRFVVGNKRSYIESEPYSLV